MAVSECVFPLYLKMLYYVPLYDSVSMTIGPLHPEFNRYGNRLASVIGSSVLCSLSVCSLYVCYIF